MERHLARLEREAPAVALRFPAVSVENFFGTFTIFLVMPIAKTCLHTCLDGYPGH